MIRIVVVCLVLALCGVAVGADVTSGTLTVSQSGFGGSLERWTLDWGSDASGNCLATVRPVQGTIERVVFAPDSGSTSPTLNYDMTLTDIDGVDVLAGTGANLSNAVTASTVVTEDDGTTYWPMATHGALTLAVTSAGASRGGIVRIYTRR